MLHEYKNNIKIYFPLEKKHLIKTVENIAKEMIQIGINKDNKIDMFVLFKSLLKDKVKKDSDYIFIIVIEYICKAYYDIITIQPFQLKKVKSNI